MARGNTVTVPTTTKSRASTKKSVRLAADDGHDMEDRKELRTNSAGSDHLSGQDTDNGEDGAAWRRQGQEDEESRRREQVMMIKRMAKATKTISEKLPVLKTQQERDKRDDIFSHWDALGHGILSRTDVDNGIHQTLGLDELYKVKPAVRRAFRTTKALRRGKKGARDDEYIGRCDFRILLEYLKKYFELYHIFTQIAGHDRQITLEEFSDATDRLIEWGAPVDRKHPDQTFDELDTEGNGKVDFIDFTDWAIRGSLRRQMEAVDYQDTEVGSEDEIEDEVGDVGADGGEEFGGGVVMSDEDLAPQLDTDDDLFVTSKFLPGAGAVSLATTMKKGKKQTFKMPTLMSTQSMLSKPARGGDGASKCGSTKTTHSISSAFTAAQRAKEASKLARHNKVIANQVELWKRYESRSVLEGR